MEPTGHRHRAGEAGDTATGALDASILIATRRRPVLLAATLGGLARLATDGVRFEVIVVDNSGDDATTAVLAAAPAALPLVVLREPRPGKNRALNRALPVARGALLVFTDDDVEPDPRWLVEHVGAARRWPAHAIFGGPIAAKLPPQAPPWLATHTFPVATFARYDPALPEGPCAHLPFGPNFAVRAAWMAVRTFREDFGAAGGDDDVMGGETELLQRLRAAGAGAVFVPAARVAHVVEPHQTTAAWLLRRAFRHGRTYRRLRIEAGGRAGGAPRLCAKLAARWLAHGLATGRDERARLDAGLRLFHARGQLYEYARTRPAARRIAELLRP